MVTGLCNAKSLSGSIVGSGASDMNGIGDLEGWEGWEGCEGWEGWEVLGTSRPRSSLRLRSTMYIADVGSDNLIGS